MKERLKKEEYSRRLRMILKFELNTRNKITAIGALAVPVLRYRAIGALAVPVLRYSFCISFLIQCPTCPLQTSWSSLLGMAEVSPTSEVGTPMRRGYVVPMM